MRRNVGIYMLFKEKTFITHRIGPVVSFGLHLLVLAGACLLIFMISEDTLHDVSFIADPRYLKAQLWICVLFLADLFVDFLLAGRKLRFLARNFIFVLICVPYVNIIHHWILDVRPEWQFVLRLVPMCRAAFVLAFVTASFRTRRMTSILVAYLALLGVTVYFSSVMFFVEEHAVNPGVHSFRSAIYWTIMNMTTTGCDISEYTAVGKALAVAMSAVGLILFPVFTVYVMDAVSGTGPTSGVSSAPDKKGAPTE